MARILLLDNFDSFTYNLEHYLVGLGCEVVVRRNNDADIDVFAFDAIVLSPGPGLPHEAGDMMEIIRTVIGKVPILGVCLGMQAIALHLGGELENKDVVSHGISTVISVKDNSSIFKNVGSQMKVGLYHSWKVLPSINYITLAVDELDNTLMSIGRNDLSCYGVQFHPESIMTPEGIKLLQTFVELAKDSKVKMMSI